MVSPAAESMASVVGVTAAALKAHGFRKRRHSFNRKTGDGLVHVVDFQMGPRMPPGTQEFPPIRVNLCGKFTINVGVFLPQLAAMVGDGAGKVWVNEYNCQLRQRIGALMPEHEDIWWALDDPEAAADTARDAVERYGLPWLDHINTVDDVLTIYGAEGGSRWAWSQQRLY